MEQCGGDCPKSDSDKRSAAAFHGQAVNYVSVLSDLLSARSHATRLVSLLECSRPYEYQRRLTLSADDSQIPSRRPRPQNFKTWHSYTSYFLCLVVKRSKELLDVAHRTEADCLLASQRLAKAGGRLTELVLDLAVLERDDGRDRVDLASVYDEFTKLILGPKPVQVKGSRYQT